ncbi:amino acid ABC transporter substrate-binding protein, partial [Streptomyces ipomoeae]
MPHRFRAAETGAAPRAGAVAAGLLLLLATACGSRLPESDFERRDTTTAAPQSREPLRVGIITSVT